MKSYLQLILDCFAAMDIEGLRLYLKEEAGYQNTSKEVFLHKIAEIFVSLQKSGDSSLNIFPGACCHSQCNPDLMRSGYRFIGNHSKNFFDLRLITTGDGKDQAIDILEILNCNFFETYESAGELGEKYIIEFFKDEELDFPKSPEFLIYSKKAVEAFEELFTTPIRTVELQTLESWLLLYRTTADYIYDSDHHFEFFSCSGFSDEYGWLDMLVQTIQNLDQADILTLSEQEVEKKLIAKVLRVEMILESGYNFSKSLKQEGQSYAINYDETLLIVGEEIDQVGKFLMEVFQPIQKRLIELYFALSEADIDQILELEDLDESDLQLDLLTTHLNIREKAKMNGQLIPYYLGRGETKDE